LLRILGLSRGRTSKLRVGFSEGTWRPCQQGSASPGLKAERKEENIKRVSIKKAAWMAGLLLAGGVATVLFPSAVVYQQDSENISISHALGVFIVADPNGWSATGSLLKIDPVTGVKQLISSGGLCVGIECVAIRYGNEGTFTDFFITHSRGIAR